MKPFLKWISFSKDEIERQKTALNNANLRLTDLQEQVKALEVLIQDKK